MAHADSGLGRLTRWARALAASGLLWSGVAALPGEAQAQGAALPKAVGTFTYWGGLIFSEEANAMLVQRIKQWGQERGVPVDVVMINQNETVQRVSAAVEAGTMPDALDMGRDLMLLLSRNNRLEPVDDVFDRIGREHGGWLASARLGHQPQGLRRQALRRPVRHVRQSPEPPRRPPERGGLQGRAADLGGAVEAGGGGPAAAEALRHGFRALQRGRRQPDDGDAPVVGRPHRGRRRQAMHPRQRADPRLPEVDHRRVCGRALPAGRDHVGRRR